MNEQLARLLPRPSAWFYGIVSAFIALNSWLLTQEFYLLPLIPVVLLILFSALVSLDKLVYFILFFTPFSLTVEFNEYAALTLPTEPLLFGVMLVFFFKLLFEGGFDRRITKHPVTIAIIVMLLWMSITSLTSTMPLVSIKFTIARMWFVVSFYFVASQVFRKKENIRFWIWLFTIPLSIVIIYSIIQFFHYNIDKNALYWVMQPFFKDHTIYGAVIAMMLPVMFVFAFDKSYSPKARFTSLIFFFIIFIGIIVSYTRAAWLSIAGAYVVYLIFLLKVNWRVVFSGFLVVAAVLFYYQDNIMQKISSNKQSSSQDLAKHLKSVSNIKNDASNLERINRWKSAIRMFQKKPILGFGPGTYRFQYAPYQRSYELTYVSTNAGTLGNAHSEYLGPLAESGIIGSLCYIVIVVLTIATGRRVYITAKSQEVKFLAIGILIGLSTYFLHSFLNNFLDQDKASAPFWSMIAMLVALDVFHNNQEEKPAAKELSGIDK
ncbi:MAG TPA: O-antigen ligase family protein [Flavobacteriales bacterium]|nr:O-antigen ligase family protein [Flavobacteriales bacterium]